jgi:hypothetical protein
MSYTHPVTSFGSATSTRRQTEVPQGRIPIAQGGAARRNPGITHNPSHALKYLAYATPVGMPAPPALSPSKGATSRGRGAAGREPVEPWSCPARGP